MNMLKTPMSVINEFCMRHNVIPHYELAISAEKEYTCNLTFSYLSLNEIETTGKGRTKRGAKHCAALAALKLILLETGVGGNSSIEMENIRSPCEDESKENYIKKLKNMCDSNMLPAPDYVTVCTEGVQFKMYTMQCRVSGLATEARAYSKKHAKQHAADYMIEKLLSLRKLNLINPVDDDHEYDIFGRKIYDYDPKNADKENCNGVGKRDMKTLSKYSKINISDYFRISEMEEELFFLNYAVSQKFEMLENTLVEAIDDPKSIIEDISKTSEVQFMFNRIERVRNNARNQRNVYVALKSMTPPLWIVFGKGADESEAQRSASRKMLTFLKDMIVTGSKSRKQFD